MSRLQELIAVHCPDGVESKQLSEAIDYEQPTKYLVSSANYDDTYCTPVLTAGKSFVLGFTNEEDGIYEASPMAPVIIFDDFTTASRLVEFPFKAKSSAMKMLTSKDHQKALLKYAFHAMQTLKYTPDEHRRHWIGIYSKLPIPLPPLPVQEEIVRILDGFTNLIADLEDEIEVREKQLEHYREELLTFEEKVDA